MFFLKSNFNFVKPFPAMMERPNTSTTEELPVSPLFLKSCNQVTTKAYHSQGLHSMEIFTVYFCSKKPPRFLYFPVTWQSPLAGEWRKEPPVSSRGVPAQYGKQHRNECFCLPLTVPPLLSGCVPEWCLVLGT